MLKFLGYYGIQPRIRRELDDLIVLEGREFPDNATRQGLKNYADKILGVEFHGSDKRPFERLDEGHFTLTSADSLTSQEI